MLAEKGDGTATIRARLAANLLGERIGVLSKSGLEVHSFAGQSPVREFQTLAGISGEGVEARPIAMSSDGSVIAIGSETDVLVFKIGQSAPLRRISGQARSVSVNPQGDMVAVILKGTGKVLVHDLKLF
jgi:hypothetical protein